MNPNEEYLQRTPKFEIEILKFEDETPIKKTSSLEVQSYNFSETLDNFSAPFSLTMHLSTEDEDGMPLYQVIEPYNIVIFKSILDGGGTQQHIRYIGFIESINISSSVSGNATNADIQSDFIVTGSAITALFDTPLNFQIWRIGVFLEQNPPTKIEQFGIGWLEEAGAGEDVSVLVENVIGMWQVIFKDMLGMGEDETPRIIELANKYILAKSENIQGTHNYPKMVPMPQGTATLSQYLQEIGNHPISPMYVRMNAQDGVYELILDKEPLIPENWKNLEATNVERLYIKAINLHRTMKDTVTINMGLAPAALHMGSKHQQYLLQANNTKTQSSDNTGPPSFVNKELAKKFGFRIKELTFEYFDYNQNVEGNETKGPELIENLTGKMKTMYEHNHEFYSGNISIAEDFKEHKIGRR
ncbi:MAG: hypothetical protein AAF975_05410, partial [Spirochaetota bacterium]